jgi:uncharacterized membrane protein YdjX (TVP38/TMEM64 family)
MKHLQIAIPVITTIAFSYLLQIYFSNNQGQVVGLFSQYKSSVIFLYILLQSLAIVFPPVGGMVFLLALIAVIGPKAIFVSYFVTTPCYILNFVLAKKYGRPLVEKIVGKEALIKFDHLTQDAGLPALVALKIFLGGTFDYIAYAVRLTQITLKDFVKINVLAGIPGTFLLYFIFLYSKNITSGLVLSYLAGIVLITLWALFNHRRQHQ